MVKDETMNESANEQSIYVKTTLKRALTDRIVSEPELSRLSVPKAIEVIFDGWRLLTPEQKLRAFDIQAVN